MKAMLLAAGYGKRMRPLTDVTPKPLLPVADKPLLQYHVEKLRAVGVTQLVVNLAHLGEQIAAFLGDGSGFDVEVSYSPEPQPLETGGALSLALEMLGAKPFLLLNADIWSDYPLQRLVATPLSPGCLGRLVLVPNPGHNPAGDFALQGSCVVACDGEHQGYTFSGISLLDPRIISAFSRRRTVFPLREALQEAINQRRLQAEVFTGEWWDVGTPERLQELDTRLRSGVTNY